MTKDNYHNFLFDTANIELILLHHEWLILNALLHYVNSYTYIVILNDTNPDFHLRFLIIILCKAYYYIDIYGQLHEWMGSKSVNN